MKLSAVFVSSFAGLLGRSRLSVVLAQQPEVQVGDTVTAEGYIMDYFCIFDEVLLDNPSVRTLEGPDQHSVHCLVDVSVCRESAYEILGDPVDGEILYTRDLRVDEAGKMMLIDAAREVGICSTCTGAGTQRQGFRASVTGVVTALGTADGTPPTIRVTSINGDDSVPALAPEPAVPLTTAPATRPSPVTSAPSMPIPMTRSPVTTAPLSASPVTRPSPVTTAPLDSSPMTSSPTTSSPTTTAPSETISVTSSPETTAPSDSSSVTIVPDTAAPSNSASGTSPSVTPVPVASSITPSLPVAPTASPSVANATALNTPVATSSAIGALCTLWLSTLLVVGTFPALLEFAF